MLWDVLTCLSGNRWCCSLVYLWLGMACYWDQNPEQEGCCKIGFGVAQYRGCWHFIFDPPRWQPHLLSVRNLFQSSTNSNPTNQSGIPPINWPSAHHLPTNQPTHQTKPVHTFPKCFDWEVLNSRENFWEKSFVQHNQKWLKALILYLLTKPFNSVISNKSYMFCTEFETIQSCKK